MATPNSQEFICKPLDDLKRGSVELRAPLYDGVIQIGNLTDDLVGMRVTKIDPRRINVEREDGLPIHAEVVVYDENMVIDRLPVFKTPVRNLSFMFRRGRGGQRLWSAHAIDIEPTSVNLVQTFAVTLGNYALHKQGGLSRRQTTNAGSAS